MFAVYGKCLSEIIAHSFAVFDALQQNLRGVGVTAACGDGVRSINSILSLSLGCCFICAFVHLTHAFSAVAVADSIDANDVVGFS